MKKFIVSTLLTASLLMPLTANANRTVAWQTKISGKTYYATVLKVTKIDHKKNRAYCKNWCGYSYDFAGIKDLEKGDTISCIMWTKWTSNIKDDIPLTAKYERIDLLDKVK